MTTWRTIPQWPSYQASTDGRIRNKHKRVLKPEFDRCGYLRVKLYRPGSPAKNRRIHVLVAQCFLDWYEGCDVNHEDRDKTNCAVDNLSIMTHQENCLHRYNTPAHNLNLNGEEIEALALEEVF